MKTNFEKTSKDETKTSEIRALSSVALKYGEEVEKDVLGEIMIDFVKDEDPKLALEVVKYCLEKGVNPNFQDKRGYTSLLWASKHGYLEIVKLLLRYNADPNVQNKNGDIALRWAFQKGHVKVVKLLLENKIGENKADPNIQNNFGSTVLYFASDKGHLEVVKLLLEHDADPNIQNKYGGTALNAASRYGHSEVVKLLLEHGADFNQIPKRLMNKYIHLKPDYLQDDKFWKLMVEDAMSDNDLELIKGLRLGLNPGLLPPEVLEKVNS